MSVKGFLDDHYEKKRQAFYFHVRPWIVIGAEMAKATGWRMSHEQCTALIDFLGGMNSYERKVLLPLLDDLAVCEKVQSCLDQFRTLGELDVATTYDEAVQRELAPLLVKRLRESAVWLKSTIKWAEEHDRWLEATAQLKELAYHQQVRADQAEAERDTARKQAATWEIQAQDLRDQLIQVKSELAALKVAEPTYACFACGQPMETRLCWECAK